MLSQKTSRCSSSGGNTENNTEELKPKKEINECGRQQQQQQQQQPQTSRAVLSIPRDLSHSPAISGLSSKVQMPLIQRCHVLYDDDDDAGDDHGNNNTNNNGQQRQRPLEHMIVIFEEDGLKLRTSSLLGKGGFGRVYAAHSNGGELYALKASAKKMTEGDWARLHKEVELMNHFSRHPNVVRFITAGRDNESAYVVMECCASRSLHDVIANYGMEVPEILWVGWALVDTIAFLHSKGCIHRDLKPQNLLFDFDGNLKITDFGLSSCIAEEEPRRTVAGTAMYMAPEIAHAVYKRMVNSGDQQPLQYGKEVDTWSIGVVFYVMLTRMNPYLQAIEKNNTIDMNKMQKTLTLFDAVAGASWSWPKDWSGDSELCEVVNSILHRDSAKRATLHDILKHPVWNRRPLSCPLSLLQKLNLLERTNAFPSRYASTRRSLSRATENVPLFATKKTTDDVLEEGFRRVVLTEQRARARLIVEHRETLLTIVGIVKLLQEERNAREGIKNDETKHITKLMNQRIMQQGRRRRGGSETLVSSSSSFAAAAGKMDRGGSRSGRQSSVMLVTPEDSAEENNGVIVRASPDKYAVVYPGRDTATRWSLRPVISLPRELNSEIEEFKCMNNHRMTKLTAMPHGYNGFDCNVCDREIMKISPEIPAFRCYKCDYDLCMRCAYQRRLRDVNFVCVSCTKKFTSSAKLQAHSLQCRGPSWSPSPRRSSRMNTMVWEDLEPKRGSLLDVRLPKDNLKSSPRNGRQSELSSTGRASSGGRISIGNSHVSSPEDVGAMVVQHRDASFPDVSYWTSRKKGSGGGSSRSSGSGSNEVGSSEKKKRVSVARKKTEGRKSSNDSFSFELPPQVSPSKRTSGKQARERDSAETREAIEADFPPFKKERKDSQQRGDASSPYRFNEKGNIIGIAARHRAAQEAGFQQQQQQPNQHGQGTIVIRAETAAKPQEMPRQSRVPRSVSSSRAVGGVTSKDAHGAFSTTSRPPLPQMKKVPSAVAAAAAAADLTSSSSAVSVTATVAQMPPKARQPSAHGGMMTLHGGPPLPRNGPGMLQNMPRAVQPIAPSQNFFAQRQPSHPLVQPSSDAQRAAGVQLASGVNNAFLALPRESQNRQRFVDDFLSGGWVRFYSFTSEEAVVMYYCVQPGRYGAIFPTEVGIGTAVVDLHSRLVLYVPCMNNESTNRSQPHPHVQTFYDEDVLLLSVSEAQRYIGSVLESIMAFVNEIARLRAEGLTPAAVHAAYIHQRDKTSVPTDTKFVYVRKVFPDPSGSFALFRLSNLRSQVVCNTLMDIRWQSDRRNNVGQKYYVFADGTAEPFLVDHTGILSQVETVLSNNYRR